MIRTLLFPLLLASVSAPAHALTVQAEGLEQAPPRAQPAASAMASLASHLQAEAEQVGQLDRLYEGYASRRQQQEALIVGRQDELARAENLSDRRRAGLRSEIQNAQRKMEADLLAARARALKILTPVQRAQLEALAQDARVQVRRDRYYQLLLMPVQAMEPLPLPRDGATRDGGTRDGGTRDGAARDGRESASQRERTSSGRSSRNRSARRKGTVRYGAYGGYAYGQTQYGVGASYGRGPVGVHAGIGRGGPAVGVSIGGVLGRGW